MTVQRRKDTKLPRVFMHKVADIRGGVSVKISELGGDYLHEGAVLSAADNGICHVVKIAEVVVPDHQLSLAIGKSGQNVRLAAKLCGWKIDIKSHTQAEEGPSEEIDEPEDEIIEVVAPEEE